METAGRQDVRCNRWRLILIRYCDQSARNRFLRNELSIAATRGRHARVPCRWISLPWSPFIHVGWTFLVLRLSITFGQSSNHVVAKRSTLFWKKLLERVSRNPRGPSNLIVRSSPRDRGSGETFNERRQSEEKKEKNKYWKQVCSNVVSFCVKLRELSRKKPGICNSWRKKEGGERARTGEFWRRYNCFTWKNSFETASPFLFLLLTLGLPKWSKWPIYNFF